MVQFLMDSSLLAETLLGMPLAPPAPPTDPDPPGVMAAPGLLSGTEVVAGTDTKKSQVKKKLGEVAVA